MKKLERQKNLVNLNQGEEHLIGLRQEQKITKQQTKNLDFLNSLKIKPKILAKNSNFIFKKVFFGKIIKSPLILSPMGHQTQFHKLGEIAMAKAICKVDTIGLLALRAGIVLKK